MNPDMSISNGRVVTSDRSFEAAVLVEDGRIVAVGDEKVLPEADSRVDAEGLLVMPGVVDPHVHVDIEPAHRVGDFRSETRAAAVGGTTTIVDFAWQGLDRTVLDPEATIVDGVEYKRSLAEGEALVDYGFHGAIIRERPESLEQIRPAIEAGVTSFKMYRSTYHWGVSNGFVDAVMKRLAGSGAVAVMHTEDPSICEALTEQFKREGKGSPEWYPKSRPDYAEAMSAADAARLATAAGAKYYGIHTTCRKAADVLAQFREDGSKLRAETCTHYTVLDESIHAEMGNLPLIAPPIRPLDDVDAMFEHLRDGTLSVVSTDHCEYKRRSKDVENWWESPFGANSLQTSLPVFYDEAVNRRGHSPSFVVELMCRNPAETFGLESKGHIGVGYDADIVLFDPETTYTITADDNVSNADFTMYEGREVTGRVERTYVRGELVAADGEPVGPGGHGVYQPRAIPDWEA